jgi:hypothetical protein
MHVGVSTEPSIQSVQNQINFPVQFILIYPEKYSTALQALNIENWE